MPEKELTQEQVIEAIYGYAAEQMQQGVPVATIEKNLMEQGLDAASAKAVLTNLQQAKSSAIKQAAMKNMLFGALWCIGGLAVTALTYQAASNGGKYVVAWGAVIFGAIQFFRGLFQLGSAGSE